MSGHHVVPVRVYLAVFAALMVFTAITVAAAFVDLGALNNVVMLAIAVAKATLVVMFFMHVRYSTRLIPVVVFGGVFFLLVMFGITMSDYVSRGFLGAGSAWPRPWAP
ncbi:MAG: Caa(3)-type oxidase, subunit [Acidobacteria bacterium]|jgi:cytochrome c oxidase subunit 4|nr:Caa(3)-type oxidase, subunit [Acidobacteriota bacterium]